MVAGGVEESSEPSHVTNRGSVRFLPGFRGTCPEALSSCRGGRCQGSPSESTREFQLEQGLARLEKLREEAVAQPDPPGGGVVPHDDELSRLRAAVAELEAQRVGSQHATTVPAQSVEEINLLRATVAELRRERTSLLLEVARQTDVSGDEDDR